MRILLVTFITLFFISDAKKWCSLMSSGVSGSEGLPPEQLSFAKFKDIPIPDGAVWIWKTQLFSEVMMNGLAGYQ